MWRALDHTADAALQIEAASWPELLAEATRAFGEWTFDGSAPDRAGVERLIEVHGNDRVETWVCFWRALHRLWTVEGLLPLVALVDPTCDEHGACAHVACAPSAALDLSRCIDVKAITWHGAEARELGGLWRGVIVLDL